MPYPLGFRTWDLDSSDSEALCGLGTKVEEAADLEALSPQREEVFGSPAIGPLQAN